MSDSCIYTCPQCQNKITAPAADNSAKIVCPSWWEEFDAATSQGATAQQGSEFALPEKLPFLKSSRRKLLQMKLEDVMASNHGMIDAVREEELNATAIALGLDAREGSKLLGEHFMREFEPIKRKMESTFVMTDEDVASIEKLKRKYNVGLSLQGNADLFRSIYLLESTGRLPTPIRTDLMLNDGEMAFYSIATTWHQARVRVRGYSSSSVSIPIGRIRFRFGGYTPIRTEEMTPISTGVLYVTSKRLLFNGESKNTTISLNKIVDGHVYSDCVKIEKGMGKPDLFSMDAARARYILSLVGVLRLKGTNSKKARAEL